MTHPLRLLIPLLAAIVLLSAPCGAAAQVHAPELIVLVRHAETAPDGTRDPALSASGVERAERLAALFEDAGLTRVLSSPYRRTRATAAPIADALGREVEEYDPRALADVAAMLLAAPGRHLVVGHSNTTPMLVELLGGEPGPPIAEDEHGRVYVLAPAPDGIRTLVLHY